MNNEYTLFDKKETMHLTQKFHEFGPDLFRVYFLDVFSQKPAIRNRLIEFGIKPNELVERMIHHFSPQGEIEVVEKVKAAIALQALWDDKVRKVMKDNNLEHLSKLIDILLS